MVKKTKVCAKCKKRKKVKFFNKHRGTKDKLCSWCVSCHREASKIYINNLPRQVLLDRMKASKKRNPLTSRIVDWKRQGIPITREEFIALDKKQGNRCAICKTPESELDRKLSVDHCHSFLKVRGLVCRTCNLLLGNARDSVAILRNAIKYIQDAERGR